MEILRQDLYQINSYDCDLNGELTLPALNRFLSESAWKHSDEMEIGFSHLIKKNMAWVLYKEYIQMNSWPKWGETITVKTWPSQRDRLFCYREFEIYSSDKLLGKVTTSWIVINILSRRPVRTKDYFVESLDVNEKINFPKKIRNKMQWENRPIKTTSREIKLMDLDVNQHVNNSYYASWCLDFYTPEFIKSHKLSSIEQQFVLEARFGDILDIVQINSEKNCDRFVIYKENKEIFKLELNWI